MHCSTTNGVINTDNIINNLNLKKSKFERPIPKSLIKIKPKTSFAILNAYTKSRIELGKSKSKNISQDHNIIKNILQLIEFTDLKELSRESAECIRNSLKYYPKNSKKYPELKNLKGFELIEKNDKSLKPRDCISSTTIKGYIHKFSTFLSWAKNHHYIEENVFYKLPTLESKIIKKRFPFSDEQLNNIFNMPSYTAHKYLHPYYYWVPLLLRYSGARLNEICQLREDDIKLLDGIQCIMIRENFDDQSVKNISSIRFIPIHHELIKNGFLSFVSTKKNKRLFPELPSVKGYYSNNASKWFSRCRAKLGLGKGFDAHSFRHTFINELKQKYVSKEIIECIVGHEHKSESFDIYSEQYNAKILAPIINLISCSHTVSIKKYH